MIKIQICEPDEYASGYTHWDAKLSDSSFNTQLISEEKWARVQEILKMQNVCQDMLGEIFSPILKEREEAEEKQRIKNLKD